MQAMCAGKQAALPKKRMQRAFLHSKNRPKSFEKGRYSASEPIGSHGSSSIGALS